MAAPDRSRGVFETLLVRDGAVQALAAHLARLRRSTASLYGLAPPSDLEALIRRRATALGTGEHRLRVDSSPGAGGLQVAFETSPLAPRPALLRLAPLALAGGYGEHKLADRGPLTSSAAGGPVALLVDGPGPDATVLEAAWANVWLLTGGRLITPPLDRRILPGVTRARLIEQAASLGLAVVQEPITLAQLSAGAGDCQPMLSSSLQLAAPAVLQDGRGPGSDAVDTIARIRAALLATDWE